MKNIGLTLRFFSTLIVMALLLVACTKDETDTVEQQNTDALRMASEMDDIEVALEDVIIISYEGQESLESNRMSNMPPVLPECVTVNVLIQQNHREITLDFGTEGCFVHGRILRGQIVMTYDRDPEAQEILISYTLVDFYINQRQILGNRTILRELSNDNGNPQFTHSLQLTVIWPNGMQASRDGLKVREWIEGFGSGDFADNVFEITGHWNSTFVNGNTHSHVVVTPLRREATCLHFVSGTIDVERTNFSGVLDFGDGTCDDQATFTFDNGNVISISLD